MKTNWFSVGAIICMAVLFICTFLGMFGVMTVGQGWGIFTLSVGFNGVICAVLSHHKLGRPKQ